MLPEERMGDAGFVGCGKGSCLRQAFVCRQKAVCEADQLAKIVRDAANALPACLFGGPRRLKVAISSSSLQSLSLRRTMIPGSPGLLHQEELCLKRLSEAEGLIAPLSDGLKISRRSSLTSGRLVWCGVRIGGSSATAQGITTDAQ
jgi:hypothetical protein